MGRLSALHAIKMKNALVLPPLSKEDKLRKRIAAAVPLKHALSMVTPLLDEKKCIVKSFEFPTVQYSISLKPTNGLNMNEPEGLLQSCTCPDNQRCRRPCKHIYLLDWLYVYMRVDYHLHPEQVDESHVNMQEPLAQALPNWIPLPVRQYLNVERARECEGER